LHLCFIGLNSVHLHHPPKLNTKEGKAAKFSIYVQEYLYLHFPPNASDSAAERSTTIDPLNFFEAFSYKHWEYQALETWQVQGD
jgi:hypothetical protein